MACDNSPFFAALESMIKERGSGFAPIYGHHGSINALPLNVWLESDKGAFDREAKKLMRKGKLTVETAKQLLSRGMPRSLEEAMLERSGRDEACPGYFCIVPQVPEEYYLRRYDLWGSKWGDELVRKSVIGKIVYCMHCYLGAFLARDGDAVKALYYPGDLRLALRKHQRLASGVLREICIFKYFDSLLKFWETFEQMYEVGKEFVGLYDDSEELDRQRVEYLLRDDAGFLAMFNLMAELTEEPLEMSCHYGVCDDYRRIPLQDTIDLPQSARDLLLQDE